MEDMVKNLRVGHLDIIQIDALRGDAEQLSKLGVRQSDPNPFHLRGVDSLLLKIQIKFASKRRTQRG